jgi:hypothetical protein
VLAAAAAAPNPLDNHCRFNYTVAMETFIYIWILLAILMPAIIGLLLILNPQKIAPKDITIKEVGNMVGIRNIALSIIFLFALLQREKTVLAYFMLVRGLTDFSDAVVSIKAKKTKMAIAPLISSLVSFAVSLLLWDFPVH